MYAVHISMLLICISLMINDIEHLFNVLLVDYIFFGKRSVKNFLFMFPLGCLLVSKFKNFNKVHIQELLWIYVVQMYCSSLWLAFLVLL